MTEYKRLTDKKIDLDKLSEKAKSRISDTYIEYAKMNNALWEIENKIENGTLIELPCKVGGTVYYETFKQSGSIGVKPHKVIGFVLEVMTQNIDGFGCTAVPIRDFGETVFLTEAEAKLKELQEKE